MAAKKRKKHYSPRERAELREKAERNRRRAPANRPPAPDRPLVSTYRDPDHLVDTLEPHANKRRRSRLRLLVDPVLERRPGLVDAPFGHGLCLLARQHWLQEPAAWRPRKRGLSEAFRSLAIHLLGRFPVSPHLWDSILMHGWRGTDNERLIGFVASVAQGRSVRALVGTKVLPVPLTRRMCHLLVNPPRPMDYVRMVRRAQVLGYGGSEGLVANLSRTYLNWLHDDETYWAEVVHWLCRQGHLPYREVDLVVDYLDWCEADEPVVIRGRSFSSLSKEARRWRNDSPESEPAPGRDRSDPKYGEGTTRPASGLEGWADGPWSIAEIRTRRKLVLEGTAMRHCVSIYGNELAGGSCSYWSLTRNDKRALTIEVSQDQRRVINAHGRTNREPRAEELRFLADWATLNEVSLADHLNP